MATSAATRLAGMNQSLPGFKPGVPSQRGTVLESRMGSRGLPYLQRVPAESGQVLGQAEAMGYKPGTAAIPSSFMAAGETPVAEGFKRVAVPSIRVEMNSRLPRIILELPIRMNEVLGVITKRIAVDAALNLVEGGHVITGDLAGSIEAYPVVEAGVETSWAVGSNIPYAPYIEYGTDHVPGGYPYLRPAVEHVAHDVEELVGGALAEL